MSILPDCGVGRGARLGPEWGAGLYLGINPLEFLTLKDQLESELGVEVVDASPTIWKATTVKSDLEIERMRVAVRAAACALDRLLNYIEIGMDEMHVSQVVSRFMLEEGGDRLSHAQVMSQGSGARFGSCDALDRPVERDWVNLDIGCRYRRYGSDINRGVFLGREPTPEDRKLYECRKGVNEFLDGYIKPGVVMDDALYAMKAYVESQGCELLENRGSLFGGHAIGLENYQHPSFTLRDNQPEFKGADGKVRFEPGMMFTYEMPLRLPGHDIAFNIEDDVVVTAEGVENMNAMVTRDMRVKL